jgi:hypothetical protein
VPVEFLVPIFMKQLQKREMNTFRILVSAMGSANEYFHCWTSATYHMSTFCALVGVCVSWFTPENTMGIRVP